MSDTPIEAVAPIDLRLPSGLTWNRLLEAYKTMCLSRALDIRIWTLNRQGKAAIAASAQGHEAAQVATVMATDPTRDRYMIYYRQLTATLMLGTTPSEMLMQFLARDGEILSGARQFPLHGSHPRVDLFSFSNVVGTQLPQSVGVALADKMKGRDAVTVSFFGDGAASQGDCHEAMNFAGIHKVPVVFLCENNRYAISVPLYQQMPVESIASRAFAYGIPGVEVDGTDVIAAYEAVKEAVVRARSGGGASLVEMRVERLLPHTTDDDHTRYRSEEDIERMQKLDPLKITGQLLRRHGILDDATDAEFKEIARRAVDDATDEVEALPFPPVQDMYNGVLESSMEGESNA
jgi:2-oxoisovalerate dehydrogenase E1 component alpha subunit